MDLLATTTGKDSIMIDVKGASLNVKTLAEKSEHMALSMRYSQNPKGTALLPNLIRKSRVPPSAPFFACPPWDTLGTLAGK